MEEEKEVNIGSLADRLNAVLGRQLGDAENQVDRTREPQDLVPVRSEAVDRAEYTSERPVEAYPQGEAIGYGRDYEVNIRPITSGYILRVGCQEIAVESGSDVAKLIQIYLSGDKTIGDKWMNSDKIVQNFIKENLEVK